MFAECLGARLTYVLQPIATWTRSTGCREEETLFEELDQVGRFTEMYGDILDPDVGLQYAESILAGTRSLDVNFININPILATTIKPDQWLFVDRIHFTDEGHDFVSKKLLEALR